MSEEFATARRTGRARRPRGDDLAIVLGGGGARAAYQAGFLRGMSEYLPELRFPIITGVSAGAINASWLASHPGPFADTARSLADLWLGLSVEQVFRVDMSCLLRNVLGWAVRLVSGGSVHSPRVRGLVDTRPLGRFLDNALGAAGGEVTGIAENVARGRLKAFALSTLNYATGQTITWVQGSDIETWNRPNRRAETTRIGLDHIMASAALPLIFPAIKIDGAWYGDGGIRLSAPLSPALHLGASRVLTISTRYGRNAAEAGNPATHGYPPPAQVMGNLLNAIFLDLIDQDAERLERLNGLVKALPEEKRRGLRPVELLVIRPSRDLGRLAGDYEVKLPGAFRFLTRGLGTRETRSPDFLSLLMFQDDYLDRLIAIGEEDAAKKRDEVMSLLEG